MSKNEQLSYSWHLLFALVREALLFMGQGGIHSKPKMAKH